MGIASRIAGWAHRSRPRLARALLAAFLALTSAAATAASTAPNPPNIVLFVVDDLGWMDTTAYGSRYYDTPNVERLARAGMLFTDAWAASPFCSPSRASLLTGRYAARFRLTAAAGAMRPRPPHAPLYKTITNASEQIIRPESLRYLPLGERTIAEILRARGYRTAHIGKWHLGRQPKHWPDKQGFQVVFHGEPDGGPPSFTSPYRFLTGNLTDGPPGEYLTDRLTDEALRFIEASRQQPFFLNLWHYGVHGPWGHRPEITRRFEGLEDPRGKQGNAIMASMIKSIDDSLGRLLDKLEELQLADRTVVILTSDNGGHEDALMGPEQLPPTNNDPLREGKGHLYEGGLRVPLIISGPGVAEPGSRSLEPVSGVDLVPTLLAMTATQTHPDLRLDGLNLSPVLRQAEGLGREGIFGFDPHGGGHRPPGVAVRSGAWKLIRWFKTNASHPYELELYNLRDDIGETNNLAFEEPATARRLDRLIDGFLTDTAALLPKPNPGYDPATVALLGWRLHQIDYSLAEGRLRLEAAGPSPFMRTARLLQLDHTGPLTLQLRLRGSHPGGGRVQWTERTKHQDFRRQVVDFTLPADGRWHDLEVVLPVEGEPDTLDIYMPASAGAVEFEWIRLRRGPGLADPQRPPLISWEFVEVP